MKTRRPLAGEKTLPILQFRTREREGQARTAVGTGGRSQTAEKLFEN
jgi:hypothetical protein